MNLNCVLRIYSRNKVVNLDKISTYQTVAVVHVLKQIKFVSFNKKHYLQLILLKIYCFLVNIFAIITLLFCTLCCVLKRFCECAT